MREILFRGKQTDNGEWVYGSFIPDIYEVCATDEQKEEITIGFIRPFYKGKAGEVIQYVSRNTVGQYTGLKDKYGKKIFEGDIIEGKVTRAKTDRFVIRWNASDCGFTAREGKLVCPNLTQTRMYDYEVIGNIHDNPELLKGDGEK